MSDKPKATRRLSNFNFQHDGAHVALVGPSVGGPANGITTLVTKSTVGISPEVVQKASEVTVTLQFPEFLRRFFGMYWEDSEILSLALGYGLTEEVLWEDGMTYKEYLDAKVKTMQIMKSVYKAEDVEKALSELTPDQMLSLLQDQEVIEKAMSSALPAGESLNDNPPINEEHTLETILKSAHEELVTKAVAAALEPVQKALDDQTVILKAAQDKLAEFEAATIATQEAARKEQLSAVVAEDQVETLFKSLAPLDDASFEVVLQGYRVQKAAVDASEMMNETGMTGVGETDQAEVDNLKAILKAKYPNKSETK